MTTIVEREDEAGHARAIGLLILGVAFAALNGALMKLLVEDLPVLLIAWGRYAAYLAVVLPIALWVHGSLALAPPRLGLQLVRSLLLVVSTLIYVEAIVTLPFADSVAIVYVYPFVVMALAPALLGERVKAVSWIGIAGGFIGVLIVMRPEFNEAGRGAVLAFISGLLIAFHLLVTRMVARAASALVASTFSAALSTVVLSFALPFVWQPVSLWQLGIFAVLGIVTALSQGLTLMAYARAPAPLLAPFAYAEIAAAVMWGFLIFSELPDAIAWVGIAVIIASGVMVVRAPKIAALLERRRPPSL